MISLLLLGLLFTSHSAFAETYDCMIALKTGAGQITPKTGTIEITDNQAMLKNWGSDGRNLGPMDVIKEEGGRIRIDYFKTGENFKKATNFNLGIVLTPQDGGTYKYDLTLIDSSRSDTCILR